MELSIQAGSGRRHADTERWEFLPKGGAVFSEKYGTDADARIRLRRSQAISGIPTTPARIKQIAEAERAG